MSEQTKAKIDKFLHKFVSRKLIVFIVACTGLFSGYLTADEWVIIAGMYVGTQAAIDAIERLKGS